ncbi:MAG: nucleoside hydrolase, partial [Chloroflexota bacterium]|nr:nucleoside hydrolase [Chloroflexota bacterium]
MALFLDVDTGVDDAMALAVAVRSGARVIGVSTVAGNVPVHLATANTLSVLSWLGTPAIPVHRGASRPLALPFRDAVHVHGTNGLGGAELAGSVTEESRTNGVQAILDAAEAHEGQLVLAALGPLTNLAMALNIRPKLVYQVRKLAVMCGAFKA